MIIAVNVIIKEAHLGRSRILRIFPVIVHRAIAIIIDAKISMTISLMLHKINIEISNAVIESQLVEFKLYN